MYLIDEGWHRHNLFVELGWPHPSEGLFLGRALVHFRQKNHLSAFEDATNATDHTRVWVYNHGGDPHPTGRPEI